MKMRIIYLLIATWLSFYVPAAPAYTLHNDRDDSDPDSAASVAWVEKDGEKIFEYEIPDNMELNSAAVSPSGNYIFIHITEQRFVPGDVYIFRLHDGAEIGYFDAMPLGGNIFWAYGEKIIFISSAGSYNVGFSVFDITGTRLYRSTHCVLYSSRDGYFVVYSPWGSPTGDTTNVEMYNVNTHTWTVLAEDVCKKNDEINVDMERGVVEIVYHDGEGKVIDLPPSPSERIRRIEAPNVSPSEYSVREGDTLWSIADLFYGNGHEWARIVKANKEKIGDDGLITSGMRIVIPGE